MPFADNTYILPAFPTFHHYYHHFTTNAGSSCIKWGHRHIILRLPLGNCKSYLHFRYTTALAVSSSKNTLILQESTFRQYFVKIYILVYRTRRKCRSSFRPVSFMMFRSGGLYWISPKPLVQSMSICYQSLLFLRTRSMTLGRHHVPKLELLIPTAKWEAMKSGSFLLFHLLSHAFDCMFGFFCQVGYCLCQI